MPFLDTLLSKVGLARKTKTEIPLITGTGLADPFALWLGEKKLATEKAMAINTGWVYTCVRAISEEIAKLEFRLFQIKDDDTSEEIPEHELLDLLEGVNQFMTGFELKYQTGAHLELAGNAYWLLDGVENEGDLPTAIYPLNPRYMKVIKEPLPKFISGYQYRVGNKLQIFQPYQILHFKYPDPNDPYEGIGTVQAILDWINADNFASQVNLNYFKNGARLSGVLESESYTTAEQLDYIAKSFRQLFSGAGNAYQIAALPKGTKYNPLSDTPKDMDFANLQQVMRDKILSGFRVSKTILGTAESDTNRATAETADYVFAARTIKPKMQLIVAYLNEFLVPRFGENLYLDFVDPVPENREFEIQQMTAASGGSPVLSPNELRERYFGAPPITGGDAVRVPISLSMTIGAPAQPAKNRKPQSKFAGKSKPATKYARRSKTRKSIAEEIAKAALEAAKELEAKESEVKSKQFAELTENELEIIYKVFATRVAPYHLALKEKIRSFNTEWKMQALKNLDRAIKTKAIDEVLLFDREVFVSALIDLSEPILTELYGKEGVAAAEAIGAGDVTILTPEVRRAIQESVDLMSNAYNDETLALLKQKLSDGLEQGATIDELKDLVSQVAEFSDEVRAERVAETETFRIANSATKEAWKQAGVVKTIKWYTAIDERVCPFCAPLHGKVVGIEDNFFNQGDVVVGERTDADGNRQTVTMQLDYADVGAPPLHVSCRCYVRPEEIALSMQNGERKGI